MRTSPLYLALAFFCGVRASAQTTPASDSASVPAAPRSEASTPGAKDAKEGEDPPVSAPLELVPINLGIAPGTATNGEHPERVRNYVSLDVVAGEAGAIKGVQGSIAMNEVHDSVKGVQLSGGLNRVDGKVSGFQASSVNLVKGDMNGYQGAYFLNRVGGDVRGYQTSSFGNLVKGNVYGVQASSLYGKARTVKGVQFNAVGVADTLYGVQWGLVNWSGRMKGAQFGLVNITKGGDGAQVGLVNVRPDTRMYAESWFDETRSTHLALNYGGPHFYSLVEGLYAANDDQTHGMGLGFGVRSASPVNIASFDLSELALVSHDGDGSACGEDRGHDERGRECSVNLQSRARLVVGRHLWKRFAVFGGVSYNLLVVPDETGDKRVLRPVGSYQFDPTDKVRLWPGFFVGVRI